MARPPVYVVGTEQSVEKASAGYGAVEQLKAFEVISVQLDEIIRLLRKINQEVQY